MNSQVSKRYVSKDIATKIHEKAKPFLKWLQEAEEEESSDDDDEDGDEAEDDEDEAVEVAFTNAEKVGLQEVKPAHTVNGKSGSAENESDDDIDLDDI